jgi:hypothetical protein
MWAWARGSSSGSGPVSAWQTFLESLQFRGSGTGQRESRLLSALFLLVLLCCLSKCISLTFSLHQAGAFTGYDTLFESDPNHRLECFADGWHPSGRNFAHPNLCNIVNPPIRAAATLFHAAGVGQSVGILRQHLALLVVPVAGLLQWLMLNWSLALLGVPSRIRWVVALGGALSFTGVFFSSIPEHYGLSGALLACALVLAALAVVRGRVIAWPWVLLGTLAASVTITNLAQTALYLLVAGWCCERRLASLRHVLTLVGGSLCGVVLLHLAGDLIFDPDRSTSLEETATWLTRYVATDPFAQLTGFPLALLDMVVAPGVVLLAEGEGTQLHLQAGWPEPAAIAAQAVLAAVLLAGAWQTLRQGAGGLSSRCLLAAALVTIAGQGLVYAFWGSGYFLYSQHFIGALLLVSALFLRQLDGDGRRTLFLGIPFLLALGWINFGALDRILELLRMFPEGT